MPAVIFSRNDADMVPCGGSMFNTINSTFPDFPMKRFIYYVNAKTFCKERLIIIMYFSVHVSVFFGGMMMFVLFSQSLL